MTMTANNHPQTARARIRIAAALRLDEQGMTPAEIAERLGVTVSAVQKYLRDADRSTGRNNRVALDRITQQLVGLGLAADAHDGTVIDPQPFEVARWLGDLNRGIRALNRLRNRVREGQTP